MLNRNAQNLEELLQKIRERGVRRLSSYSPKYNDIQTYLRSLQPQSINRIDQFAIYKRSPVINFPTSEVYVFAGYVEEGYV